MKKLILIILVLIMFQCKKKKEVSESDVTLIGEMFLYSDDIPIYEEAEPSKLSEKIKKNEKVKILQVRIPDKKNPDKAFWYQVFHANKIGYIPLSEETNKHLVAFLYANPLTQGKITASSLRIRETPDLKGKVLGSVPKSTIITILWEGLVYEKIDDKYDTWMKIKTSEGLEGFSYAGYITKNLNEDLAILPDNAEEISGYVEFIEDPNFLVSSFDREVTAEDSAPCGYNSLDAFPKKDDIHRTKYKATKEGVTYYQIENAQDEHGCYTSYRGWVSEKQIIYFDDIYKYTLGKYSGNFDKKFLEVINEAYDGKLNVKTLKIEPYEYKLKNYSFYKVNYSDIFYKFNEQYFLAGKGIYGEIVDINKDGIYEVIAGGDCACLCSAAKVIIWNGQKFEIIFEEFPPESLTFKVEGNTLIAINSSFSDQDPGTKRYFQLSQNTLKQINK